MSEETILVVDDDIDILEIISMYLKREGYKVMTAMDGYKVLEIAFSSNPSLIILDMMLPGLDGIDICQELRKKLNTPIIFLSSKSSSVEISQGLIAGGDDYITKPFNSIELVARVKAHLRRNRILRSTQNNIISLPNLIIDLTKHTVTAYDQNINLSPKEFQLLSFLAKNPNRVFSNEELFNALWGTESFGDYRTIMVHISNIRKKIDIDNKNPTFIQTIKGVGYKLRTI
ncbi:MAG: response regulator [Sedimentibacter sp.]